MQLKETGKEILNQISNLTDQLSDDEYSAELDLLNGNTIGKHVRHIVEFFDLLVSGSDSGLINYDRRKRELSFESDTMSVMKKIQLLNDGLERLQTENEAILEVSYGETDEDTVQIKSSIERELAYNIEHAIHHMAIIKIAVQTVFPTVQVAKDFGVAYSTVRFQGTMDKQ